MAAGTPASRHDVVRLELLKELAVQPGIHAHARGMRLWRRHLGHGQPALEPRREGAAQRCARHPILDHGALVAGGDRSAKQVAALPAHRRQQVELEASVGQSRRGGRLQEQHAFAN
eukprot:7237959-Prymnesium_polylepis.1